MKEIERFSKAKLSIRAALLLLVLVCILPPTVFAGVALLAEFRSARERVVAETNRVAENYAIDIARELSLVESGMRILGNAGFERSQLGQYARVAGQISSIQAGTGYQIVSPNGELLVDGSDSTLDYSGTIASLAKKAAQLQSSQLSELFLDKRPARAYAHVVTPIRRGNGVELVVGTQISASRISTLLTSRTLPEGWVAAVLDPDGTIVARSRDADRFTGTDAVPSLAKAIRERRDGTLESTTKDGVEVYTAFRRVGSYDWAVAVGAPKAHLLAGLYRTAFTWAGVAICVLLGGVAMAGMIGSRIGKDIRALVGMALAVGTGRRIGAGNAFLKETNAVAHALAVASENLAQATRLAQHDALTGLANRRQFDAALEAHIEKCLVDGGRCHVLAIDLDNFKSVNDRYGHDTGDAVLKLAALIIQRNIDSGDIAARMGGDEFFVLIRDGHLDATETKARTISKLFLGQMASMGLPVSMSVGIAALPDHGFSASAIKKAADVALYNSKREGKGLVRIYTT